VRFAERSDAEKRAETVSWHGVSCTWMARTSV